MATICSRLPVSGFVATFSLKDIIGALFCGVVLNIWAVVFCVKFDSPESVDTAIFYLKE